MGSKCNRSTQGIRGFPILIIFILLFAISSVTSSSAAEVSISSDSYLFYFERDVAKGGSFDFVPFYEYISADVGNLKDRPVSFHINGWGRIDLGDNQGGSSNTGDLSSAFFRYNHPRGNGEIRLGRFFFAEGTAADILDGIYVKGVGERGFGLAFYSGIPVEHTITTTDTGDFLIGGRLFYVKPGYAELGLTLLYEDGDFQGEKREVIGLDFWTHPFTRFELVGSAQYNSATDSLSYQDYLFRYTHSEVMSIAFGYEDYKYKGYFQTALHSVFSSPIIDPSDEEQDLSISIDWALKENLKLEGSVKTFLHDKDDPGDATRFEVGARYRFNELENIAGITAAFVTADKKENEYFEIRGYGTYSYKKWLFALDGLTQRNEKSIMGKKSTYQAVGSARFTLLPYLNLLGNFTYTKSPRFEDDFMIFLKASLQFNRGGEE